MKRVAVLMVVAILGAGPSYGGGYAHLTCSQFTGLDAAQQVLFTRGFRSGLGTILGVLQVSVRAVAAADPGQAKGAEMAAAGLAHVLSGSGEVASSDEAFAKSVAARCAEPKYAERPATSAAIDLLMGKP